jgi:hypothetical protein
VFNLNQRMKKLEPAGMDLLEQVPLTLLLTDHGGDDGIERGEFTRFLPPPA